MPWDPGPRPLYSTSPACVETSLPLVTPANSGASAHIGTALCPAHPHPSVDGEEDQGSQVLALQPLLSQQGNHSPQVCSEPSGGGDWPV